MVAENQFLHSNLKGQVNLNVNQKILKLMEVNLLSFLALLNADGVGETILISSRKQICYELRGFQINIEMLNRIFFIPKLFQLCREKSVGFGGSLSIILVEENQP